VVYGCPGTAVDRAGRHGIDAVVFACVDRRPKGDRGLPGWRLRNPGAVARFHEPVRRPARRTVLSGAGAVPSRTLDAVIQIGAAQVRVLPIRGRVEAVHWGFVRVDGAGAPGCNHRPAVAVSSRARPSRRTAATDHAHGY